MGTAPRIGIGNWVGRGGGASASYPMPEQSDLGGWWRPEDILPQADGSGLANWTDIVSGITISNADSATQPLYRTNARNGTPGLEFTGGTKYLTVGRPAPLITALNRANNSTGVTMFFCLETDGTNTGTFRSFWSPKAVNDISRTFIASKDNCGSRNTPRTFSNTAGLKVIIVRSSSIYNLASNYHFFDNFNCYATGGHSNNITAHPTNDYELGRATNGATVNPAWGFCGKLYDWGFYNSALSNVNLARLIKSLFYKRATAFPWAGLPYMLMMFGNSYSSLDFNNWFYKLMALKGVDFNGHTNMAVPSWKADQMTASVPGLLADLAAELGLPLGGFALEYYNQPDINALNFKTFLSTVRSVAPDFKMCAIDSIDNGQPAGTPSQWKENRAPYNAAVAAAGASYYDLYAPLSTDVNMGLEGTNPEGGPWPTTYFNDIQGHPTSAGGTNIRDFMSPYFDSLVAML